MPQKTYNSAKSKPLPNRLALYQIVMQRIMQQLASGQLKPGQYLPSEWDLARQWQVSQGTIRKGLNELVLRGLLQRQQGIGTLVTHKNWDWGDYPLVPSPSQSKLSPMVNWPVVEILSVTAESADAETAQQLQLRLAESVWKIVALWRNGYQVVALDEAFLPMAILPELNIHFVHRRGSFYGFLLQQYQMVLNGVQQCLWMQYLNKDQQKLLKHSESEACVCWGRLSTNENGALVEWRRRFLCFGHIALQLEGMHAEV